MEPTAPRAQGHGRDGPYPGGHAADGEVCSLCPLCVAMRLLAGSHPEVASHLRAAARELASAVSAAVEVGGFTHGQHRSAAGATRGGQDGGEPHPPGGLRRIRVE